MNQHTKIAVLGGTGKAGKYLVKELLHRGFQVKLLLRTPEKFQSNSHLVEVVKGDARDPLAVDSLVTGCSAVISAIGQPRGEESIFSQATHHVVAAMAEHSIRRYILLTGLNVDTPFDEKSEKVKMATEWMRANYPKTTLDKQIEYEFLLKSDVDWTLVRLPLIEVTDERHRLAVSTGDCVGDKVNAPDLASFLADQLSDATWIRKAPFVANWSA